MFNNDTTGRTMMFTEIHIILFKYLDKTKKHLKFITTFVTEGWRVFTKHIFLAAKRSH